MKPGKTSLPAASMISAPAGAGRFELMAVIFSPSHSTSAVKRRSAVTMSPSLIRMGITELSTDGTDGRS